MRSGFPLRPVLIGATTLVLLAIVAVASRAGRPSSLGDPEARTIPAAFWDYAVTLGLIASVAVLVLAVLVLKVPLVAPRRRPFGFSQLVAFAIVLAFVAYAGTRIHPAGFSEPQESSEVVQLERGQQPGEQADDSSSRDARSAQLKWTVLFGAGVLALVGLGAYLVRRRLDRARFTTRDAATALVAVLDESVDDLRAERDPRRAVIAAYARMERALEGHGFPRFRSEAPLEYLARVLRELFVRPGDVLALTELFERAKFSTHEIDTEMKEEAIGALLAVRDDLRRGDVASVRPEAIPARLT